MKIECLSTHERQQRSLMHQMSLEWDILCIERRGKIYRDRSPENVLQQRRCPKAAYCLMFSNFVFLRNKTFFVFTAREQFACSVSHIVVCFTDAQQKTPPMRNQSRFSLQLSSQVVCPFVPGFRFHFRRTQVFAGRERKNMTKATRSCIRKVAVTCVDSRQECHNQEMHILCLIRGRRVRWQEKNQVQNRIVFAFPGDTVEYTLLEPKEFSRNKRNSSVFLLCSCGLPFWEITKAPVPRDAT